MSLVWALLGVILFSWGGLKSTHFWEEYIKSRKLKLCIKTLSAALILLLLGAYLSTYYWNEYFYGKERCSAKDEMITILYKELSINKSVLEDRKFCESVDSNLSTFVVFPRLHTAIIRASIASRLFIDEEDKKLFSMLFDIDTALTELNHRIDITEKQMLVDTSRSNIYLWRKKLRDSKNIVSARGWTQKLSDILKPRIGIEG